MGFFDKMKNLVGGHGVTVSVPGDGADQDASDGYEIPARTASLPLNPRPYLERFKEMIADLEAHPQIKVTETKIGEPASTQLLNEIAENHPLPEAMRRFYQQANGLTVRWETNAASNDEDSRSGCINILPIEQVYGSWKDVIWFDEDSDEKHLHPLDFFVEEACCALYLDGSDSPTVHYHYCGEETDDLEVDFAGYLELLLKSRGFWYWPTAIVTDLTGEENTTAPGLFRRNMPKLFADYDPKFFLRRRYEDQEWR